MIQQNNPGEVQFKLTTPWQRFIRNANLEAVRWAALEKSAFNIQDDNKLIIV